jgi:cytochrome b
MDDKPPISSETEAGDHGLPASLLVWDLPVRVFHWLLVISVLSAWCLAGYSGLLHETAGYVALALVLFRLVWGFVGTRFALFADFVKPPKVVLEYLCATFQSHSSRHIGHNPAGGVMIVLVLGLIIVIGTTGFMQTTVRYFGVAWVETAHRYAATALIWLVPLHIIGVIVSSRMHGENLLKAMFTGRKPIFTLEEAAATFRSRDDLLSDRVRSIEAFALLAFLLAAGTAVTLITLDKYRERERTAAAAEAEAKSTEPASQK